MNTIIIRRSDFVDSGMFDSIAEQLGANVTPNRERNPDDELTIGCSLIEYVEEVE